MLIALEKSEGRGPAVEWASSLIQAARALMGKYPNLDFGLVTLAAELDLPSGSPIALFALAAHWAGSRMPCQFLRIT